MPQSNVNPNARQSWMTSLALLPGAVLSLLPSMTCPFCIAAYAGMFSAIGLGFLVNERVLAPLIGIFLFVGVASVAWSTRSHRRPEPLIATIAGSAAVVAGRLIWSEPAVLYVGIVFLIGASLWNLWLKRPRSQQVFQIHRIKMER